MGNRLSCIYPAPAAANFIRIVHALDGRTCELLEEPMKVGELMLEFPGHFVTEYDHQQQSAGKRVSALPADHDTCAHHVYFLLPMHRLNTRLSAEELHRIATPACKSATAKAPAQYTTKVTPLSAHQYEQAAEKVHTLQSTAGSYSFPVLNVFEEDAPQQQPHHHTLTSMRPWTPKLDTIVESSPLTV